MVEFDWSGGNEQKVLERHGFTRARVEAAFAVSRSVIESLAFDTEQRWALRTVLDGQAVAIIFTMREGRIRPISARPMSRKERLLYGEKLGYVKGKDAAVPPEISG